jgi:hypothetical protein
MFSQREPPFLHATCSKGYSLARGPQYHWRPLDRIKRHHSPFPLAIGLNERNLLARCSPPPKRHIRQQGQELQRPPGVASPDGPHQCDPIATRSA